MTQALINSLNTITNFGTEEISAVDNKTVDNFNQILELQTSTNDTIEKETDSNQNSLNIVEAIEDFVTNLPKEFSDIFKETIAEAGAEYALDISLSQDENPQEILPEKDTDVQDNTEENENTTIINEDPETMHKMNLTQNPENPTNLVVIINQNNSSKLSNQDNYMTSNNGENTNLYSANNDMQKLTTGFSAQQNIKDFSNVDAEITANKNNHNTGKENLINEKVLNELNIEEIESQTSNQNMSSGEDLMQNQSPQEQSIKAMLNVNIKYDDISFKNIENTAQTKFAAELSSTKIIEQITKQLEGMQNTSKVNIVLNPESLGKIMLQIINSKDGLSAQFTVSTQNARNLLTQGLDNLKESLLAQGINVDSVNIKLNESEESSYNPDWTEQESSKGSNKEQQNKHTKKEKKQFEQMMFEINNNDTV